MSQFLLNAITYFCIKELCPCLAMDFRLANYGHHCPLVLYLFQIYSLCFCFILNVVSYHLFKR
jgi:hypothetical protein